MKLQKITDVRVGQIWTLNNYKTLNLIINVGEKIYYHIISWNNYSQIGGIIDTEIIVKTDLKYLDFIKKGKLIGFLGITHKKDKNWKFIKIPRDEFEIDDIVEYINEEEALEQEILENSKLVIIDKYIGYTNDFCYYLTDEHRCNHYRFDNNEVKRDLKKIGIYGVDYEFVNNNLEKIDYNKI
ncbi:MAG: hypothetical protein LBF97_06025 [Elusimicrobiota bacterium]|nr:hypothetical protein [Elusimicrobiota bacterium]